MMNCLSFFYSFIVLKSLNQLFISNYLTIIINYYFANQMFNNQSQNTHNFFISTKNCLDIFKIRAKPIEFIPGDHDHVDNCAFFNFTKNCIKPNQIQFNTSTTYSSSLNFANSRTQSIKNNPLRKKPSKSINEQENDFESDNCYINNKDESLHDEPINATARVRNKKTSFPRKRSLSATEFLFSNYTKGITSEEMLPDSPFVYSLSKFHPFSYLTGHHKGFFDKKGKLNYPSPTLIDSETWIKKPGLSKQEILRGMEISDKNGLVLVDKEITKKFKGIVKELVGQLIKSAFTSQKFSLSVKLFEPKSFLQSLSEYWFYLPNYLPKAGAPNISPIERMENIMAFAVSGLYIPSKQLKAFNPLVGETFQGEIDCEEGKIGVYLEQISNYPNVSRFYVTHELFTMSGYFDISMKNESLGNKITLFLKGTICVDFKKINQKIYFCMPNVRVLNGASDNRSTFFTSSMIFTDITNNLKGIIRFGMNKKNVNQFEGAIIKTNYPKNYKFIQDKEIENANKIKLDGNDKKNKLNILAKINGSWLKQFCCGGKIIWDIDRDTPSWIIPVKNCLPSDGRFREDIIWLYRSFFSSQNEKEREKYEQLAQNWKLMLEKLQREERETKNKRKKK